MLYTSCIRDTRKYNPQLLDFRHFTLILDYPKQVINAHFNLGNETEYANLSTMIPFR